MAENYLTLREVAEYLRTSEKTVRRLLQRHDLPGFKLGGTRRFRRSDIEAWVEERLHASSVGGKADAAR